MNVNDVPQDLVDELRAAFLKKVETEGAEKVHPKDVERAKQSDHWLRRFIKHQEKKVPEALNMLWTSVTWRKEFGVNDINENNVEREILEAGGFFPLERDVDGHTILVFKCKKHQKNLYNPDALKRCIVYWFERVERQVNGEPITIFFDMEGCGISNMDIDLVKYLIGLFKEYYPYFLNYIIIYELPWILNASLNIIKMCLPEKAVERIRQVKKKDLEALVPRKCMLTCWGGDNNYFFVFEPEAPVQNGPVSENQHSSKKVHFVDGSPMSESAPTGFAEKEQDGGGQLKVTPSSIITFVKEGNDLVSTVELQNIDSSCHISFKFKTTSPEKFRVKPSAGGLAPGASTTVTVTLLPGFQLGGLTKDKFLVMSTPIDEKEASSVDLTELWKNTAGRKVTQHRLRCVQGGSINDITRNGNAVTPTAGGGASFVDQSALSKLTAAVADLSNGQAELRRTVSATRFLQQITLALVLVGGVVLGYMLQKSSENGYCHFDRA